MFQMLVPEIWISRNRISQWRSANCAAIAEFPSLFSAILLYRRNFSSGHLTDRPSEKSSRREGVVRARHLPPCAPLLPRPPPRRETMPGVPYGIPRIAWSLSRKIKDTAAHSPKWMFLAGLHGFANRVCNGNSRDVDFRERLLPVIGNSESRLGRRESNVLSKMRSGDTNSRRVIAND